MSDDPREDLARQLLHSTAVERLDPAPGTFEHLTAAGARRRSQRRLVSTTAMAAVVAFVVGLVIVVAHGSDHESTLQPGGKLDNFLNASKQGQLKVAATIHLGVPTSAAIIGTEAPNGAFFYAASAIQDSKGRPVGGTAATNVVKVVDGTSAPAVAEHAPGRVVGLAADAIDLYVATPTEVIRYSRTTGDEIHTWPLLTDPVNSATMVTAGKWLYVLTGFQCDYCGINTDTLLALNLVTGARHVLSTEAWPMGLAGTEQYVYYFGGDHGLVRVRPNGHGMVSAQHLGANFPAIVGLFRQGLLVQTDASRMTLFDPIRMTRIAARSIASTNLPNVVPDAAGGAFFSSSQCASGRSASECRDTPGRSVGRINVVTGRRFDIAKVPNSMFLLGPAPAVVTVDHSSYDLVRLR